MLLNLSLWCLHCYYVLCITSRLQGWYRCCFIVPEAILLLDFLFSPSRASFTWGEWKVGNLYEPLMLTRAITKWWIRAHPLQKWVSESCLVFHMWQRWTSEQQEHITAPAQLGQEQICTRQHPALPGQPEHTQAGCRRKEEPETLSYISENCPWVAKTLC